MEGLIGLIIMLVIANVLSKLLRTVSRSSGEPSGKGVKKPGNPFAGLLEELSDVAGQQEPVDSYEARSADESAQAPPEVTAEYELPDELSESRFERKQVEYISPVPSLPDEETGFSEDAWEGQAASNLPVDRTDISAGAYKVREEYPSNLPGPEASGLRLERYRGLRRAIVAFEIIGPCRAMAPRRGFRRF